MTTDYTPIACGIHDRLELAIMRAEPVSMAWRDEDGQEHVGSLRLLDVRTRNKEEFLLAQDTRGQQWEIRLDRLHLR